MKISVLKNKRRFAALLLSPVLGLFVPLAAHYLVRPAGLTNAEKAIAVFSTENTRLAMPEFRTAANLVCPVKRGESKPGAPAKNPAVFPPIPLAEVAPPAGRPASSSKTTDLSLILVGDAGRVAIIDGKVLKVGDQHGKRTVAAIQNDRVLLKNGKEQIWLKIK